MVTLGHRVTEAFVYSVQDYRVRFLSRCVWIFSASPFIKYKVIICDETKMIQSVIHQVKSAEQQDKTSSYENIVSWSRENKCFKSNYFTDRMFVQ